MYLAKLDLSTDGILESALDFFNKTMSMLYDLLAVNPTKGTYKGAYGTVTKLYTTFSAIGVSLMVLFFVYGFCRDSFDVKADLTLNSSIKEYIRLVIVSNLIANFITLVPKLYSWAITMLLATKKEADMFDAEKISASIEETIPFGDVGAWLFCILFFFVTLACCCIMIFATLGRFLNLFIILPFATIALSTIAGGGNLSHTGFSYIKTTLTYIFEIVIMGIVLSLSGTFLSSVSLSEDGSMIMIEVIAKMLTITAAYKGSENICRKAFGL